MSGTLTGESPGWVAGYVPSAGEWNDWFSRKIDIDNPEFVGGPFLATAGGTMTGVLFLTPGAPTAPTQAVPKSYVDSLTFASGPFMPTTGGTFSGPVTHTSTLTLMGNPSGLLDAAPKQYVDAVGQTANSGLTVANAAVRRAGDTMTGLLVLSSDPVNPLGAVTKQYSDANLSRTGGTVTGNLGVNGAVTAGNGLYSSTSFFANAFNGYEWSFSVDGNGSKYQTYRAGWYDSWNASTGARTWVGPGGALMTLDGSGNLSLPLALSANTIVANGIGSNGNLNVAGTAYVGAIGMGPWAFFNNGNQIQQHTTGWYDEWRTSDGNRNWVGGNTIQMTLDPGGNFAARAAITGHQIFSNDIILAAGIVYANNGTMFMGASGTGRLMQFAPNWYFAWDQNTGELQWIGDLQPPQAFWSFRNSDRMCFNHLGAVGGTLPYQLLSDERAKANIEPAAVGLAEVLALRPIAFDRNDQPEIGFSAQQLREVIPLAVRPFGVVMQDGSGALDSDEPSLGMSLEPIVAALVNGMKELNARLAAMEGGAFFP